MNQEPDNLVARALEILKADHRKPSDEVLIEQAAPNAKPVFWEAGDGQILGPGVPEYLAKTGRGNSERFWVVITCGGSVRWIRSDRLRSQPVAESYATSRKGA